MAPIKATGRSRSSVHQGDIWEGQRSTRETRNRNGRMTVRGSNESTPGLHLNAEWNTKLGIDQPSTMEMYPTTADWTRSFVAALAKTPHGWKTEKPTILSRTPKKPLLNRG
ncbi:uncharacterized protein LOC141532137 [Cotesia typhae]|uniref:uncharacterized protein LOC141532137 n=1 Tax=Cotesia typhae TaxID=2053667 RepID=UPI003D68C9CC